jgi:hypothetical protein
MDEAGSRDFHPANAGVIVADQCGRLGTGTRGSRPLLGFQTWTIIVLSVSAYPAREGIMQMLETVLKRFEEPDEVRTFEKGKFELVRIGGMTIGRATYEPGWKWSVHVGPGVGASRCNIEHVGMVLSGCATAAMEDGTIHELRAGMLFYIPPGPPGHDSWVVGDAPYVSLHFLGADSYANR